LSKQPSKAACPAASALIGSAIRQVLKQCGYNLIRENVMKQAASPKDFATDTVFPGIKINSSASDLVPIEQLRMMQFKSGRWELSGDIIGAETEG
jgi:branched-chain amino acid transport system substrate-binding protein